MKKKTRVTLLLDFFQRVSGLYKVKDFAEELDIKKGTISCWMSRNHIPPHRIAEISKKIGVNHIDAIDYYNYALKDEELREKIEDAYIKRVANA